MPKLDLNTASRHQLQGAGFQESEIRKAIKFRNDNAVFVDKQELKRHGIVTGDRYEAVRNRVKVSEESRMNPLDDQYAGRRKRETYRKHKAIRPDWDVGHIVAHANGGANHDYNFVPMYGGYNKRLQHLNDDVIFAHLSEDRVRNAVRVSRVQNGIPMTTQEALQQRSNAKQNLDKIRLIRQGRGLVEQTDGGAGYDETDGSCEGLLCDESYCTSLMKDWMELIMSQ